MFKKLIYNKNYIVAPGRCTAFLLGSIEECGTIYDLINADDIYLECCHSYIQYAFPLQDKSMFNSYAPVLTNEEIIWMSSKESELARLALYKMFLRMLSFYGFEYNEDKNIINKSTDFAIKSSNWLTSFNHNYLRITRILICLKLVGMYTAVEAFYKALEALYNECDKISEQTFLYWTEAAKYGRSL